MANVQPNMTPYHYTHNNPINRIDPNGNLDKKLLKRGLKNAAIGGLMVAGGLATTLASEGVLAYIGVFGIFGGVFEANIGANQIWAAINDNPDPIPNGGMAHIATQLGASNTTALYIELGYDLMSLMANVISAQAAAGATISDIIAIIDSYGISEDAKAILIIFAKAEIDNSKDNANKKGKESDDPEKPKKPKKPEKPEESDKNKENNKFNFGDYWIKFDPSIR